MAKGINGKLTEMSYNHRIGLNGKLQCAYAITPENTIGETDYARHKMGDLRGEVILNRFGNAECAMCMRDVPDPKEITVDPIAWDHIEVRLTALREHLEKYYWSKRDPKPVITNEMLKHDLLVEILDIYQNNHTALPLDEDEECEECDIALLGQSKGGENE